MPWWFKYRFSSTLIIKEINECRPSLLTDGVKWSTQIWIFWATSCLWIFRSSNRNNYFHAKLCHCDLVSILKKKTNLNLTKRRVSCCRPTHWELINSQLSLRKFVSAYCFDLFITQYYTKNPPTIYFTSSTFLNK